MHMQHTHESRHSFDSSCTGPLSCDEGHCESVFMYMGVALFVCISRILEEIVNSCLWGQEPAQACPAPWQHMVHIKGGEPLSFNGMLTIRLSSQMSGYFNDLHQEMTFGLKHGFWLDVLSRGVLAMPSKFTGFVFSHADCTGGLWYCKASADALFT